MLNFELRTKSRGRWGILNFKFWMLNVELGKAGKSGQSLGARVVSLDLKRRLVSNKLRGKRR
jgi:hypothetical protein